MLKKKNLKYAIAIVLLAAIAFLAFGAPRQCPMREQKNQTCYAQDGKIERWCALSECAVAKTKDWTRFQDCDCYTWINKQRKVTTAERLGVFAKNMPFAPRFVALYAFLISS